jgi:hypothetical protein
VRPPADGLGAAALWITMAAGVVSLGLTFWVGRHGSSVVLKTLFTGWVASPFALLLWIRRGADGQPNARRRLVSMASIFISSGSVLAYSVFVFLIPMKRAAGPFLAVPAVSLGCAAMLLLRRRKGPERIS